VHRSKLLRYLFLAFWFALLPLLLAWVTVEALKADVGADAARFSFQWFRWVLHDQWVPALIVFFTVFEMVLYQFRHSLPFARTLGIGGRGDLPPGTRRDYERAQQLIEEASRLLRKHRRGVESFVSPNAREDLTSSLEQLRDELDRERFDAGRFDAALERATVLVERHLGRWRKSELREYAESILVAVAVAFLLRAFVVEAFKIPSGSMLPTLQIQDHIFVNKLAYGPPIPFTQARLWSHMPPKRGDVIVFKFPGDPSQDYIKRVIALPGDELVVRGGHPIINGKAVPSCRVGMLNYDEGDDRHGKAGELYVEFLGEYAYLTVYEQHFDRADDREQGPYRVAPGEMWVLGDNRNNSSDSRAWNDNRGGGVPFPLVKGRAMFVWLSFNANNSINASRLLHNVMGLPGLPKHQARPELVSGIEHCLATRPPPSETEMPSRAP
jgi:signal peptidase I